MSATAIGMSQDLWHLNVSSPLIQKGFFRWENGTLLLCFTNGVHTHHAWSAQILLQKICETQKTEIVTVQITQSFLEK